MTLLGRVAAELGRSGIATAVCGASALAIHGVARSIYDIDLITTDGRALDDGTWGSLAASDVNVEIRRGDQLPAASRTSWAPFRSRTGPGRPRRT